MNKIKITVVTVVYNCVESIEDTILSVLNQTYDNVEYIIIDGGSTDGTQDIFKKYEDSFSYWISEPDMGIYDAMNKGIKAAKGDWILFLNSGDLFYKNSTLFDIQSQLLNCDVLYGQTSIKQKNGDLLLRSFYPTRLDWKTIPYCHQSVLIKRSFLVRHLFDTTYKIAADFNQYFCLKASKAKFKSTNEVISIYDNDGFSAKNHKKLLLEYKKISLKNHISWFDKIKIIIYFKIKIITI